MVELWEKIPGWEGRYEASNVGQVRSVQRTIPRMGQAPQRVRGGNLTATADESGYLRVHLRGSGVNANPTVHSLVLAAFVGPRPIGMEACHWNGHPSDNRIENLRWDTSRGNSADTIRMGRARNGNSVKVVCLRGHPFDAANTHLDALGYRSCRKCGVLKQQKYRARVLETCP